MLLPVTCIIPKDNGQDTSIDISESWKQDSLVSTVCITWKGAYFAISLSYLSHDNRGFLSYVAYLIYKE